MSDPEKIDFGPLDPTKDEQRWQRLVAETTSRVRSQRGRRAPTVSGQLVAWGGPALSLAAALALVVWSGSLWVHARTAERTRAVVRSEQAAQLLQWALNDEVPPPEVVLQVVKGGHEDR
jgi:hypothetical protein